MNVSKSKNVNPALMIACAVLLSVYAIGNIAINYHGKGRTWDIYPFAEVFWVICSLAAVRMCTSPKRLIVAAIGLMFLDSFVDLCAMGNACWWASPPVLVEWKWNALGESGRLYPLLYGYWFCTWGLQVPLRCFALARMVSGGFGRKFLLVSLGLNLIWFTAPQDVLFYFIWCGYYDLSIHYFDYLPPAGLWNLWNMLLLRVPIGVTVGALIVRAGLRSWRNWMTALLATIALLSIALYALVCIRTALP